MLVSKHLAMELLGGVINTIAGNQNCNDYYYDSGWYDEDDEDQHQHEHVLT